MDDNDQDGNNGQGPPVSVEDRGLHRGWTDPQPDHGNDSEHGHQGGDDDDG